MSGKYYAELKCELCGEIMHHHSAETKEQAVHHMVARTMYGLGEFTNMEGGMGIEDILMFKEMTLEHNCADGSIGMSTFCGYRYIGEKEEI